MQNRLWRNQLVYDKCTSSYCNLTQKAFIKVAEKHWLLQELKIMEYSLHIKGRRTLLIICSHIGRCRRIQLRRFWRPSWSRICNTNAVSFYPRFIWRARRIYWWMRRLGFLVVLLVFPYHFQPNISLVLRMSSQIGLIFELIFCSCRVCSSCSTVPSCSLSVTILPHTSHLSSNSRFVTVKWRFRPHRTAVPSFSITEFYCCSVSIGRCSLWIYSRIYRFVWKKAMEGYSHIQNFENI